MQSIKTIYNYTSVTQAPCVVVLDNGKEMELNCSPQDFGRAYHAYHKNRMMIQDAFPFLTNEEREFLISGLTPEEWNRIFSNPEEF